MKLLDLITGKIDALEAEDAAAKFFGVTVATIRKWYGGTAIPTLDAAQRVLDAEIEAGRIIIPGFAPEPKKEAVRSEDEQTTVKRLTSQDLVDAADKQSGAPTNAVAVVSEASALVKMTPDELELQLSACLSSMPNDNRFTMLKMLADGLERKVSILLPTHSDINPAVFHSVLGLSRNLRVAGFEQVKDTLIHRARNLLAEKFLASKAEWSLWIDADMIIPFGNARWFKAKTGSKSPDNYAGINALQRLTQRGGDQTIIGGVYCSRSVSRRLLIAPELTPRPGNEEDANLVKAIKETGPMDKLAPVDWVAFGIAAVHRSVFEDMKKKMPELAPKSDKAPFNFFSLTTADANEDIGEDKLFCDRAKQCGHQSWLDLSVHAAHVGNYAFLP